MKAKTTYEAILLLGTNKGQKKNNINIAKQYLEQEIGQTIGQSKILKTKAIDFRGNDFLNQILILNTRYTPYEILTITKKIEKKMGRKNKTIDHQYQNRIIDIDILFFNDWKIQSNSLLIPHPQIFNRPFVYSLLGEIYKDVQHNYIKETILNIKKRKSKLI